MASRLDGAARDLATQILRRPILTQCLEPGGSQLPCYDVAAGPGGPHQSRWVPEPWVGHLAEALCEELVRKCARHFSRGQYFTYVKPFRFPWVSHCY